MRGGMYQSGTCRSRQLRLWITWFQKRNELFYFSFCPKNWLEDPIKSKMCLTTACAKVVHAINLMHHSTFSQLFLANLVYFFLPGFHSLISPSRSIFLFPATVARAVKQSFQWLKCLAVLSRIMNHKLLQMLCLLCVNGYLSWWAGDTLRGNHQCLNGYYT